MKKNIYTLNKIVCSLLVTATVLSLSFGSVLADTTKSSLIKGADEVISMLQISSQLNDVQGKQGGSTAQTRRGSSASSSLSYSEYSYDVALSVFDRINQARMNPWNTAINMGIDTNYLRYVVGETVANLWEQGLPSLRWDERLAESAASHLKDMLNRFYISHITPEGLTVEDRESSAGYPVLFGSESSGAIAFPAIMSDPEAIDLVVSGLINDALYQSSEGIPLMDYLMEDVGVAVSGGQMSYEGIDYNVIMVVLNFGLPVKEHPYDRAVVKGTVCQDRNYNGYCDNGEGLSGLGVTITGPIGVYGPQDPVQTFYSDMYGRYVTFLSEGFYSVGILGSNSDFNGYFEAFSVYTVDLTFP